MGGRLLLLRVAIVAAVTAIALLERRRAHTTATAGHMPAEHPPLEVTGDDAVPALGGWTGALLTALAVGALACVATVWANHVLFAGELETMEGTILQATMRVAHGQPVYPMPTPGYVPLAYNPGFYYLSAPLLWLLGPSIPILRSVAVVGALGSGVIVYLAVRRHTASSWWGLIAAGVFAMAYRAMDSSLDNAHSDSWMLCSALLGTYWIDTRRTRRDGVLGVLACVASFWLKQHGALFAIGALFFLTWRDGLRRSWPYWTAAAVAGPALYLACAVWPFGPAFHYFTFIVPSGWSTVGVGAATRLLVFFARTYPLLVVGAVLSMVGALRNPVARLTVWHIQLFSGLGTAVVGAIDGGSSDNVFAPAGTFFIVVGTIGIAQEVGRWRSISDRRVWQAIAITASFALLLYNPREEYLSFDSAAAYADLTRVVRALDGPVYAPDLGQSAGMPLFDPGANWVALNDMSRGQHRSAAERQAAIDLLDPVAHPSGPAYILAVRTLPCMPIPVRFMSDRYQLMADFGNRFMALNGPPKRWGAGWPRYLYRYSGTPGSQVAC
jgi:hypothetical protein